MHSVNNIELCMLSREVLIHPIFQYMAIILVPKMIWNERTQNEEYAVSQSESQRAMNNMFAGCDACLWAEGNLFQQLL